MQTPCSTISPGPLLVHLHLIRHPVHFPRLSPVLRIRLLEVRRLRCGRRPGVADEDGAALVALLVVELTTAVLEGADGGDVEGAVLRVGPVDAPLAGLGIVE